SFFNLLKLRASWGKLGNQQVPFNATLIQTAIGSATMNYVFGPNQSLYYGAIVPAPARNISWEIIKEWNVGVDFGMLNSRLSGRVDMNQKTTEDVILKIEPVLSAQFGGTFYDHAGEIINQGLEIGLNWNDNITDDFFYTIAATFAYNKNEVSGVQSIYE